MEVMLKNPLRVLMCPGVNVMMCPPYGFRSLNESKKCVKFPLNSGLSRLGELGFGVITVGCGEVFIVTEKMMQP